MKSKIITLSAIVLVVSNLFAQSNNELEFNVIKPKVDFSISPAYNYLYQHISHPIEIIIYDSLHEYTYKLAGGTINETDSGTFVIPTAKNEAILNIYEIRNENEILVGTKRYIVYSEPLPFLRNKPTNNVLLDMLLVSGKLTAISEYERKRQVIPVTSFTLVYKGSENSFKSVNVTGDDIPVSNRKEIVKLPNGSMIYFENIMIELLPEYNTFIQPYRVSMEVIKSKDVSNFGVGN